MFRRNFIKVAAVSIGSLASGKSIAAESRDSIKFIVFADLHYRDGDYNWATKRLQEILDRARKNNVDFIIHCGDFCHNVKTAAPVIRPFNSFEKPHYHVMGNHDFEATKTLEDVVNAYQMKDGNFYSFDKGVFRFIVLDSNYFKDKDGKFTHYASSTAYEKCNQKEAIITPEQIDFLKEKLNTAKGPCAIFTHHGFGYVAGISNADEVKKVLFENQRYPAIWINGHHHRNSLKLINQVAFFNLNSTTSEWIGKTHNKYPPELMKKSPLVKHSLFYEKPVHAIVTITKDGEFNIEGMEGGLYLGITPEMTGNKSHDPEGLPLDASVLSSRFKLYMP